MIPAADNRKPIMAGILRDKGQLPDEYILSTKMPDTQFPKAPAKRGNEAKSPVLTEDNSKRSWRYINIQERQKKKMKLLLIYCNIASHIFADENMRLPLSFDLCPLLSDF